MIPIKFMRFVSASIEVNQLDPLNALYATLTCGLSPAELLHEDKNCIQTLKLKQFCSGLNLHETTTRQSS